jgi:hypothetical protein
MKMPVRHLLAYIVLLGVGLGIVPMARAAEEPSLQEVNAAVRAGHLAQAESMMAIVLRDHPNSAKAHFVDAEVLVRMQRVEEARRELARAEQLEPGLGSIKPETLQDLRSRVGGGDRSAAVVEAHPAGSGGIAWGPIAVVLGIGLIVFFALRARRAAMMPGTGMVPAGATPYGGVGGVGPGGPVPYGAPMGGAGVGSGIVGGLVTGAAVGAGMVAGEALAHEFIGKHESSSASGWTDNGPRLADSDNADLGVDGGWDSGGSADLSGGIGGDDWG